MTDKTVQPTHEKVHQAFLQDIQRNIRRILSENYKMKKISIEYIAAGAARLSNPIKITGVNEKGEKIRYFGKVIGSNDILSVRSIQFLKNIYLQINTKDPIFEIYETTEDMVRDQYETMQAIYKSGIPAIKPYGYHRINGSQWLLVAEFLDVKPFPMLEKVDPKQIDLVFNYLKKAHHKKIFHGDIKPDNILVGDEIYILDAGHFRKDAPAAKKQSYDLACMISSFLEHQPVEEIVKIAKKYYSHRYIQAAANYIELIQMRPDIHFTDETKQKLLHLLKGKGRRSAKFRKKTSR
jgi:tRNA A-37 threonylcarbamoyl transferase component Bud32